MVLTFGHYKLLTLTRQCVSYNQLVEQTNFDRLLVSYYIAGLIGSGLITISEHEDDICYKLAETAVTYIEEYERANPTLMIKRETDLP